MFSFVFFNISFIFLNHNSMLIFNFPLPITTVLKLEMTIYRTKEFVFIPYVLHILNAFKYPIVY